MAAEPDYIFELGANAGPIIAELDRVNRLLAQAGQNVNIAAPLEAAQQQLRQIVQQVSAATINLRQMEAAAAGTGRAFLQQQSQVRNLESTLRQLRNFQIITPEQLRNVQELEQAYRRIAASPSSSVDRNVFSQLVTNAQRLKAELKDVEIQTRQLEALGKQIRLFDTGRVGVDPSINAQINQLRDSIAATGPIATSTFANIIRGLRNTKDNYAEVTRQIEQNIQAQKQQASATAAQVREQQKLVGVYRESIGSIQAADAAFTRASTKAINDTTRLLAMQEKLRTLRQTPEVQAFGTRVDSVISNLGNPQSARNMSVELAALNQEYSTLARTAKASDSVMESMFGSFGRRIQLVASLTLAYGTLRAVMSGVQFIVDIDREMTRMATTMANAGEKVEQLPGLFDALQRTMRLTGMSASESGKLIFELQKAMGDTAGTVSDALIPALSLVVVGEANQEQALRSLVGIYNVFGDTLIGTSTAAEKYSKIADTLAIVSRNTTATAAGLAEAIQFSGARARLAGVELDQLVVFLGLLQNALQAAGRSGTGLARTFEALINNMGAVQKAFALDFGPDANPLDVMFALLQKLQREIAEFGRLTPETLRKIEEAFKLEQAGRNMEVLALQIDKFPALLAKVRTEAGASKQVVAEFGTSVSAASKILLNEFLLAIDKVLLSLVGNRATGRFDELSAAVGRLSESVRGLGESAADSAAKIRAGDLLGIITSLGASLKDFLSLDLSKLSPLELLANIGRSNFMSAKAFSKAPTPPLSPTTGVERQALFEEEVAVARQQEAAAALVVTELGVAKAKKLIAEAQREVNAEYLRMNPLLSLHERLAFAIQDVGIEEKRLKDLLVDSNKNWQLLGETQEKAAEKIAAQDRKLSAARNSANQLRAQIATNERDDLTKSADLAQKQVELVARLSAEYLKATSSSANPFQDLTLEQAQVEIDTKVRQIAKDVGGKFSGAFKEQVTGLITTTVIAELTNKQQAIFDAMVTPFRDAALADAIEIGKIAQLSDLLLRQPNISESARSEATAAPGLAVDKKLGVDVAERQLRSLTATFALFGEEARRAAFAAANGFTSFDAAVAAADMQVTEFGDRGLRLMIDGFLRLQAVTTKLNLQQVRNDIEASTRAIGDAFEVGGDPATIAANARAYTLEGVSLRELATSADAAKRELAALLIQQAQQPITLSNVENLNKQLLDLTRSNAGTAASFGQVGAAAIATQTAFQLEGVALDTLNLRMQTLITRVAEAIQKQKALADTGGLIAIGFSPETAASMASALALQDELNKKIDQGTEALSRWNQRGETAFQRQLELSKQLAIQNGDTFAFFDAAFTQAATKGHTFFDDLDTLAKNTASSMSSSMSDFFFNVLQGKLDDAQSAFKSFFLSIARELSNFLSTQAVSTFLRMFGISTTGTGANISISSSPVSGSGSPGGLNGGQTFQDPLGEGSFTVGNISSGLSRVPVGGLNPSMLSDMGSTIGNIWAAISGSGAGALGPASTGIGGLDVLLAGGSLTQSLSAVGSAMQAASGLSVAFAGVAAAMAVFDNIMTLAAGNVEEFSLRLGLGVAGGVAGGIFGGPFGALAGVALGDVLGSLLSKLFGFGGPSNYELKRQKAAQDANDALFGLTTAYKNAARQPGLPGLQSALGTNSTIGSGAARTDLAFTTAQASRLGLSGDPQGGPGVDATRVVKQWADLTTAQFERLIKAFQVDPAMISDVVRGSVNVPYLNQDTSDQSTAAAKGAAEAVLKLFIAFEEVRDKAAEIAAEIYDVAAAFLPEDIANAFLTNTINPIKQKISDVLASDMGVEAITSELTRLDQTLRAYAGLVALYGQASADLAAFTGDFAEKQRQAVAIISRQRDVNTAKVATAAENLGLTPEIIAKVDTGKITPELETLLETAIRGMDLPPELMAEKIQALLTAVKERYEFEKNLILGVEGDISKLYETHGKAIEDLGQVLASLQINASGSSTWLQGLYDGLKQLAETSLSVAERLAAATALMRNVLNALPALIAGQGGLDDPGTYTAHGPGLGVDQILPTVMAGLSPIISVITDLIGQAVTSGDWEQVFTLLEQGSQALVQAMNSAISGVRQWESIQIAAVNKTADEYIQGIEDVRDIQLDAFKIQKEAIQDQIDVLEDQRDAIHDQQTALRDQRSIIQDQIDLIQEWSNATESLRAMILDLALSDAAPPDKIGQFQLAQANFGKLFSDFKANPQAKNVGGLQTSATQLVKALGGIYAQPSSEYRKIFEQIQKNLEEALGIAVGQGGNPAELDDLLGELEAIDEQLKSLDRQETLLQKQADILQKELGKISKSEEKANTLAQAQVDEINDLRKQELSKIAAIADDQVTLIRGTLTPMIQAAADASTQLFAFMRNNNYDLLLQLTGGTGTAAWMKTAMENTAAWVFGTGLLLHTFLMGDMKTIVNALTTPQTSDQLLISTLQNVGTTMGNLDSTIQTLNSSLGGGATYTPQGNDSPGGLAVGSRYVNTGLYQLHQGEMVVPQAQAEMIRNQTSSWQDVGNLGGGTTISIGAVHVNAPHANARQVADEIPAALERAIRSRGGIRAAIKSIR